MEKVKYNCNYYNTGTGSWKLVYKQPVGSAIDLSEVGAAPQPNAIEISLTIKEECKCNAENYVDDDTGVMVAGNNITWAYRNSECDCTYDDGQGSQFPSTQICPSKFLSNNASDSFSFASLGYSDSAGRLLFDLSNNDKVQQKTRDNAISELVRTAFTSVMRDLYCDCLPTDDSVDEIQDETGRDVANPADPPIIVPDGENAPAGSYTGDWMIHTQSLMFSFMRVPRATATVNLSLSGGAINYDIDSTEILVNWVRPHVSVRKEEGTTYDTDGYLQMQKFECAGHPGCSVDQHGNTLLGTAGNIITSQNFIHRRSWDDDHDNEYECDLFYLTNVAKTVPAFGGSICGCSPTAGTDFIGVPLIMLDRRGVVAKQCTIGSFLSHTQPEDDLDTDDMYHMTHPNHPPILELTGPHCPDGNCVNYNVGSLIEQVGHAITHSKFIFTDNLENILAGSVAADELMNPGIMGGCGSYLTIWHDYD